MKNMTNDKDKYWELLKTEMEKAYEEHQLTGARAMETIKQWLLVIAFPFIIIGSALTFIKGNEFNLNSNWIFDVPFGIRPFFIFSGIMGLLLIILHNNIDLHKIVCRVSMNSFRKLHKIGLKDELDKLNWDYPIRTDIDLMKINPLSFTFWFTIFGGGISGAYISVGLGASSYHLLIIGLFLGAIIPILISYNRFSVESVRCGIKALVKKLQNEKNI